MRFLILCAAIVAIVYAVDSNDESGGESSSVMRSSSSISSDSSFVSNTKVGPDGKKVTTIYSREGGKARKITMTEGEEPVIEDIKPEEIPVMEPPKMPKIVMPKMPVFTMPPMPNFAMPQMTFRPFNFQQFQPMNFQPNGFNTFGSMSSSNSVTKNGKTSGQIVTSSMNNGEYESNSINFEN